MKPKTLVCELVDVANTKIDFTTLQRLSHASESRPISPFGVHNCFHNILVVKRDVAQTTFASHSYTFTFTLKKVGTVYSSTYVCATHISTDFACNCF